MAARERWAAVLDPGSADDFFTNAAPPPFEPGATGWHPGKAWWCSEIARTIYRRQDRTPFLARAGLREHRFFDAGSTQGALLLGDGFAVLAFRGTADLRDWLTNVRVAPVTWPGGGRVHDGFARGLDQVWRDVEAELGALDVPAFVTGHSLGGALATLSAARHPFAAAYTFGAPRVGDEAFWRTQRTPLFRVVNDRDLVARVPPRRLGYTHGGTLKHLASGAVHDVPPAADVKAAQRSLRGRRWRDPPGPLADHAPPRYSELLAR
jgi:pimeloyl-ACP methyl ester carboxylesterase